MFWSIEAQRDIKAFQLLRRLFAGVNPLILEFGV